MSAADAQEVIDSLCVDGEPISCDAQTVQVEISPYLHRRLQLCIGYASRGVMDFGCTLPP